MKKLLWLMATLMVVGCETEGEAPTRSPEVADSAGVRIVTSPPSGVEYAQLSEEPALSLGALEGPEELLFGRIASVARDGDGNLIVADNGSGEIRVFAADGSHVRTFGGKGEGPGEFQVLSGAWPVPDGSVVAVDRQLRRITHFDAEGSLIETAGFAGIGEMGPLNTNGMAGPGALLSQLTDLGLSSFDEPSLRALEDAFEGDGASDLFVRHRLDGTLVDTLTRRQGRAMSMSTSGSGEQMSLQLMVVPFSRQPTAAGSTQGVAVAGGSDYEVSLFDESGALHQIVRLGEAPAVRTDEHLENYVRNWGGRVRGEASIQATIEMYRALPMPERLPGYTDVLFADTGELWARQYRVRGADTAHWDVFGADGHHLGRVEVPTSFRIEEVGKAQLLGVSTDELGVERVEIRDLILIGR